MFTFTAILAVILKLPQSVKNWSNLYIGPYISHNLFQPCFETLQSLALFLCLSVLLTLTIAKQDCIKIDVTQGLIIGPHTSLIQSARWLPRQWALGCCLQLAQYLLAPKKRAKISHLQWILNIAQGFSSQINLIYFRGVSDLHHIFSSTPGSWLRAGLIYAELHPTVKHWNIHNQPAFFGVFFPESILKMLVRRTWF